MKLLELYSLATGLKIGKQSLTEHFYPLPFSKYITLHSSSGMQGKNYPYYQLVVDFLNPILSSYNIRIVQMGLKDDAELSGCYPIKGKTSVNQGSFILSKSLLHIGNDSVWCHRAGYLGIPLVELFGPTSVANHSPYGVDRSKAALIESHRWGRNPTFASQESPLSVSTISPEDVANSVLGLLGLSERINRKTQFIGPLYQHLIFDYVPNAAPSLNLAPEIPITARMDLVHSEQNLLALLQSGRKVTIVTKAPIDLNLLASFKGSILSYSHELGADCPLGYPPVVKRLLSNAVFFTRDSDDARVSALRFKFFDVCSIEQVLPSTKADCLRELATYLNIPLDNTPSIDTMRMRTNKFIMANGKTYLSYAHEAAAIECAGIDARDTTVIDDERLWRDLAHFMIYQPTN